MDNNPTSSVMGHEEALAHVYPAKRIAGVEDNVWFSSNAIATLKDLRLILMRAWTSTVAADSPIKPIANLGQGFMYIPTICYNV